MEITTNHQDCKRSNDADDGESILTIEEKHELTKKKQRQIEEIKLLSTEVNHFREENNKNKRSLAGILKDGKDSFQFIEHSTILYRFWTRFFDQQRMALKILKDSSRHGSVKGVSSVHVLIHDYRYSIESQSSKNQGHHQVIINLSNKPKTVRDKRSDSMDSESSMRSFLSRAEWLANRMYDKTEISGIMFGTGADISQDNFDVPVSDDLFTLKVKSSVRSCGLDESASERETLLWFFKANTISDQERKKLWKLKIGNQLVLTTEQFQVLNHRLEIEGICKTIDKLICDDLSRTLPEYNDFEAGQSMFEDVKHLLCLWHVYRPDLGYVQGMSYLMVMLFYYFEGFECFVLFANLIITRDIMFGCFSFNMDYVGHSISTDRCLENHL